MNRLTPEEVKTHWQSQAQAHGTAAEASWSDRSVIELEIREVITRLHDGERVLDAGCANGFSTIEFAKVKYVDILGFDYIPEMIAQAKTALAGCADALMGTVSFQTGDIRAIDSPSEHFDTAVVKRVIASLGAYATQLDAIHECIRVLKTGGRLLLFDATVQSWEKLNAFRREWRLAPIPMPAFNTYLDRDRLCQDLKNQLVLIERKNYASTYYVGTRIIKPLLIQALGIDIDAASPNMEWNRWFSQLPAWGEYGTQELFVFQKK